MKGIVEAFFRDFVGTINLHLEEERIIAQVKSQESHGKVVKQNKVMEIDNILKKSWKSHGISLLLIMNHAREVQIIPYIYRLTAVIWLWVAFGLF